MKILLMFVLLVYNLMAISAKDAAWVLNAQTDFNKAFKKAKVEKKMLLLVVVKDGCTWCEKMLYDTLKDENIQESLANTVTVIVDVNKKLPDTFKVIQTPAMFFIDPKTKKSVLENIGYIKKDGFLIDIISASEMMEE